MQQANVFANKCVGINLRNKKSAKCSVIAFEAIRVFGEVS